MSITDAHVIAMFTIETLMASSNIYCHGREGIDGLQCILYFSLSSEKYCRSSTYTTGLESTDTVFSVLLIHWCGLECR